MKQSRDVVQGQKGFTLIELIIIIVVLGLLAAVAVPQFIDLKTDAANAAAEGVYGGLQGAAAINFAADLTGKNPTKITTGTTLGSTLDGGLPSGWVADDTIADCNGKGTINTRGPAVGGCVCLDANADTKCDASDTYIVAIKSVQTTTAKANLVKSW